MFHHILVAVALFLAASSVTGFVQADDDVVKQLRNELREVVHKMELKHAEEVKIMQKGNDDIEKRVTALEAEVVALQSEVESFQSEVVAVQKEVAGMETNIVGITKDANSLEGRYNQTVDVVGFIGSNLTDTKSNLNETTKGLKTLSNTVQLVIKDINSVNASLERVNNTVENTVSQLTIVEDHMAYLHGVLNETIANLSTTDGNLANTNNNVGGLKVDLTKVNATVSETLTNLNATQEDVKCLYSGLDEAKGNATTLFESDSYLFGNQTIFGHGLLKVATQANNTDTVISHILMSINATNINVVNLDKSLNTAKHDINDTNTKIEVTEEKVTTLQHETRIIKENIVSITGNINNVSADVDFNKQNITQRKWENEHNQKMIWDLKAWQHRINNDNANIWQHINEADDGLYKATVGIHHIQKHLSLVDNEIEDAENHLESLDKEVSAHTEELSKDKKDITENSHSITDINGSIDEIDDKIQLVDHKISENKDDIQDLDEGVMKLNKELVHVKKEVINYCGYQSSWNKKDAVLTYEYLSVEENTVFKNEGLTSENDTDVDNHVRGGLAAHTGKFETPMEGTYRISFHIGSLETDGKGDHSSSIFIRKNNLKDEENHISSRSHSEGWTTSQVAGREVLVDLKERDMLDVFIDETTNNLYRNVFCISLI